jgi:hypothetical protein
VLDHLKAAGPSAYVKKWVFLHSGAANEPAEVDVVARQLAVLLTAGAVSVAVLGVGTTTPNHEQLDARLRDIVHALFQGGMPVAFVGPELPGPDPLLARLMPTGDPRRPN